MPDGKALVANGFVGHLAMVKLAVEKADERRNELFSQFEDAASPCPSSDGKYVVFTAKRPRKYGGVK
jgi:hypothetical protein